MQQPSLKYDDIKNAIEKRLFLGKVPAGTSEAEISELYSSYGNLTEVRVVPGKHGNDNGIAFVGFERWAHAHRALLDTDGKAQLRGQEHPRTSLVVSFAERTTTVGRGGGLAYAKGMDINRVFVGSLPEDTDESELMNAFSTVGRIDGAQVLPVKTRNRCGFVTFSIWGEAFDAVEMLNGLPLRAGGEPMSVQLAEPRSSYHDMDRFSASKAVRSAPSIAEPAAKRRRTLAGSESLPLSSDTQLQTLLQAYSAAVTGDSPKSACDLIHESIMKTRDSLKGSPPSTRSWPDRGSGGRIDMRPEIPRRAPQRHSGLRGSDGLEDRDAARLFIGGLPHECSDDDLQSLVSQLTFSTPPELCELLECRVLPGRGCGYLRYNSWDAAEEAYAALSGRQVDGWTQVLRVKWATPQGSARDEHEPARRQDHGGEPQAVPGIGSEQDVIDQGLDPTRLFIGQMARDCDAGTLLRPVFERYGSVTEWRYVQEKGILYAGFSCFEEAASALQALNNMPVSGVSKGLNVKFSQQRRAH